MLGINTLCVSIAVIKTKYIAMQLPLELATNKKSWTPISKNSRPTFTPLGRKKIIPHFQSNTRRQSAFLNRCVF